MPSSGPQNACTRCSPSIAPAASCAYRRAPSIASMVGSRAGSSRRQAARGDTDTTRGTGGAGKGTLPGVGADVARSARHARKRSANKAARKSHAARATGSREPRCRRKKAAVQAAIARRAPAAPVQCVRAESNSLRTGHRGRECGKADGRFAIVISVYLWRRSRRDARPLASLRLCG